MRRNIDADGSCPDHRADPRSGGLMRATALLWIGVIDSILSAPPDIRRSRELHRAYYRTIIALPQLPAEMGSATARFNHARWRHRDVVPGPGRVHCEHPWSRKTTKNLVLNTVIAGRGRGVPTDDLIAHVSSLIDSRLDTLLLPTMSLEDHGVIPETRGDGLSGRYGVPLAAGNIIDRMTGRVVTPDEAAGIDSRIAEAVERVAAGVGATAADLVRRPKLS